MAISPARFGPDKTARRSESAPAAISSSEGRAPLSDNPLEAMTIGAFPAACTICLAVSGSSSVEGIVTTKVSSALSAVSASVALKMLIATGRAMPGRRLVLMRALRRSAASSVVRASSSMTGAGRPSPCSWLQRSAKAVPHAPAPRMRIVLMRVRLASPLRVLASLTSRCARALAPLRPPALVRRCGSAFP